MRISAFAAACIIAGCFTAPAAAQSSGLKILTLGGEEARVDKGAGVTLETVSNVRVYRGAEMLEGRKPVTFKKKPRPALKQESPACTCVRRTFRRLRTQGFYNGTGPKSRRFTHGFMYGD